MEPAKDDIIFASADSLISSLDEYFRSIYPPRAIVQQGQSPQLEAPLERPASVLETEYDTLLAQQLSSEDRERGRTAPSVSEDGQNVDQQPPHGHLSRARS